MSSYFHNFIIFLSRSFARYFPVFLMHSNNINAAFNIVAKGKLFLIERDSENGVMIAAQLTLAHSLKQDVDAILP